MVALRADVENQCLARAGRELEIVVVPCPNRAIDENWEFDRLRVRRIVVRLLLEGFGTRAHIEPCEARPVRRDYPEIVAPGSAPGSTWMRALIRLYSTETICAVSLGVEKRISEAF